jgi:hypothetical protein
VCAALTFRRQLTAGVGEVLGHQQPGRPAVGQQVIRLVEELERRACRPAGMLGADRHGGQDVGEGFDDVEHHADADVGEGLDLILGLVDTAHEPVQQLQQHLISDVAEISDPRRGRIGDQVRILTRLRRTHQHGEHGPCDLQPRVGLLQRQVLLEHQEEAAEVGVPPFAARTLALLDDCLDGAGRGVAAGDGGELLPSE